MSRAWLERARCAGEPTELFFPDAYDMASAAAAKAICAECPVTAECLAYAIDNGIKDGIYGGLGERGRRRYERRSLKCARCGTRFEVERNHQRFVYCSESCHRAARNEQKAQSRRRAS